MPTRALMLTALLACAITIASCAEPPPASPAAAPRLTLPDSAARPCELYRLPEAPTVGDLEVGYMTRGAQIAACDAARRLAVETFHAERALIDRQAEAREERRRPWWRRF